MSGYPFEGSLISTIIKANGCDSRYALQLSSEIDKVNNSLFDEQGFQYGQFSAVRKIDGCTFEALRDPLGIEKLFYTEDREGLLHFAKTFVSLFSYGTPIFSVPAGTHVQIGERGTRKIVKKLNPYSFSEEILTIDDIAADTNSSSILAFRNEYKLRFEAIFSLFRDLESDGWKFFVALSGGLDSSIIANAAARHLRHPVACTLDLGNSEDAAQSISIARHIGLEHEVFNTTEEELLAVLKKAPTCSQDFRDFNVHCAALNLILAMNIRNLINTRGGDTKDKAIVLTGDLMNEFMCDYEGEVIEGKEYYKLPRVGRKKLQGYLIGGLDTSDRELSPFRCYGLQCVQPYAAVADLYTRLPEGLLEMENSKLLVNSFLVDEKICNLIPKIKLRAQVGSRESMGILGLCHREGFSDKYFKDLLIKGHDSKGQKIPIFIGKYDVENFSD